MNESMKYLPVPNDYDHSPLHLQTTLLGSISGHTEEPEIEPES